MSLCLSNCVCAQPSRDTYPVPLAVHQSLCLLEDLTVDVSLGQAGGEGGRFGVDLVAERSVGWIMPIAGRFSILYHIGECEEAGVW